MTAGVDRAGRRRVQPVPRPDLEPEAHAGVERRPAQPGRDAQGLGQRRLEPAVARGVSGDPLLRRHRARRRGPAAGLARAGRAAVLPHQRRRPRERAGARRRAGRARRCTSRCSITDGRMFTPSSDEAIVGRGVARPLRGRGARQRAGVRDAALEGGRHLRRRRLVVRERGVGRRARAGQRRQARLPLLRHPPARRRRPPTWQPLERRIDDDPRYALEAQRETDYYAKQAESANSLYVLVIGIAVLAGIGAGFGAANTMYAAVQARTAEIGTLRALGFSRASILSSFQIEAVALSALGFAHRRRAAPSGSSALLGVLLGGVAFGARDLHHQRHHPARRRRRISSARSSWRSSSASSAASARPGAPRACARSRRCARREA